MLRQFGCLLFAVLASCSKDEHGGATSCATHEDCLSVVEDYPERCAPRDWYCRNETCEVSCAQTCQVVREDVNPCAEEHLICNEAQGTPIELPYCTGRPIECSSTDDCPLFKPSDAGSWTCDSGICRFPGFQYASEL